MPLLLAFAALTTLGAISVKGFLLARSERRAGQTALARVQAQASADAAVTAALSGWPAARTPAAAGEEIGLTVFIGPGPTFAQANLRALGGSVYALRGEAVKRDRGGNTIGFAELEVLILLDSAGPDSMARPRVYPRGLRILP